MRFLGIDYGIRKVGLALSDEGGKVAFPHAILENKKNLIETVSQLCVEKKVAKIVLGESLNFKRENNPVMVEINKFKNELAGKTGLEIILEPEWLTSQLADRSGGRDDSAAALILQTYLDRL